MWGTVLGELVAKVALSIFQEWARNQAIRNEERAKMALAASELAQRALAWSERASSRSDGGAGLQPRSGAPKITDFNAKP